jgi:hypothetical protein
MDSKTSGLVISSIAFILAKTTIFNQFGRLANDNQYVFNLIAKLKTTAEILIENLYRVFDIQMSTILCTIIYFDRLIRLKTNIQVENFREYLIGCLVIAVKFNEEIQLSLKVWGCSRLGLYNVEIIEFEVLRFLDYSLFISKQEYENYNSIIKKFSSLMLCKDELNLNLLMTYRNDKFEKCELNNFTYKYHQIMQDNIDNMHNMNNKQNQYCQYNHFYQNEYHYYSNFNRNDYNNLNTKNLYDNYYEIEDSFISAEEESLLKIIKNKIIQKDNNKQTNPNNLIIQSI